MILLLVWAAVAALLLWDNKEVFAAVSVWRSVVITVLLILFAPVFFLSDIGEVILDFVAGEEEDG